MKALGLFCRANYEPVGVAFPNFMFFMVIFIFYRVAFEW